jgi:23S rRNA U2552 (ribose-2'-O)-methylase RlmE/FtsJ
VFEGSDLPRLLVDLRQCFDRVKPHYPEATHREGREVFLVCMGFKG